MQWWNILWGDAALLCALLAASTIGVTQPASAEWHPAALALRLPWEARAGCGPDQCEFTWEQSGEGGKTCYDEDESVVTPACVATCTCLEEDCDWVLDCDDASVRKSTNKRAVKLLR